MKMVYKIAVFIALNSTIICDSFSAESDAHLRFSNLSEGISLIVKNSPENIRLEIARISPDSIFDPPLTANRFEPNAAIFLTLGVWDYSEKISESIHAISSAEWKPNPELSGLSKLRIRFIGPWGRVFYELYLNEQKSAILYDGTWYSIEPKIFKTFLGNLTQCAVQALTKSSGRFDNPNLGR